MQHRLELVVVNGPVVVVVVLAELGLAGVGGVVLLDEVQLAEVAEDGGIELGEAVGVELPALRVYVEDELPGFGVILVEGGRGADELVEVNCLLALEVDVVEDLRGLLGGGLQLLPDLVHAKEGGVLVGEDLELVLEVAYLVVVEAREGLQLARAEDFVSHRICNLFNTIKLAISYRSNTFKLAKITCRLPASPFSASRCGSSLGRKAPVRGNSRPLRSPPSPHGRSSRKRPRTGSPAAPRAGSTRPSNSRR